jgi:hypothetical protein
MLSKLFVLPMVVAVTLFILLLPKKAFAESLVDGSGRAK